MPERPTTSSAPADEPLRRKVLGLGAKIVILAIALVAITAFTLSTLLVDASQKVMLDHELTDLSDETDLRAWELVELSGELQQQFERASRLVEEMAAGADDSNLEQRRTGFRDKLQHEIGDVFCLRVLETSPGARTGVLHSIGDAASPDDNPSYLQFESEMLPRKEGHTFAKLALANLKYRRKTDDGRSEEMFVLWMGEHVADAQEGKNGYLLIMGLALDIKLARLSSTPRHLAFVYDQDGHQLLNPLDFSRAANDLGDFNLAVADVPPEFNRPRYLQKLYELSAAQAGLHFGDRTAPDGLKASRDRVKKINLSGSPLDDEGPEAVPVVLANGRTFYYWEGTIDGPPLSSDETRVAQTVLTRLKMKYSQAEWTGAPPDGQMPTIKRVGGLSSSVSTLRVMSDRDGEEFLQFRDEVIKELREAFRRQSGKGDENTNTGETASTGRSNITFNWPSSPQPCRTCRVRATTVNLTSGPTVTPIKLLIARAVFEEEIESALHTEFEEVLQKVSIFAACFAIVALAFANKLARPLRGITNVAEAVSSATLQAPGEETRVDKLRTLSDSLPLARRDEIGILARAFKEMIENVLAAQRDLQDLNRGLESQVKVRTHELEVANAELTRKRDEAVQLARSKDEFLANVSHELRTPLNWLFGSVQFLEMSELEEQQASDVKTIRKATEDLRDLIEDILDYQKIIMDGMSLNLVETELRPLLQDVWDSLKMYAAKFSAGLDFELPDDLGTVVTDPKRLKQVIKNLGSNACKFADSDGVRKNCVVVSASRESGASGDTIVIHVRDSGRGLRPDELETLFQKFERHAKEVEGTGLGLVITRGLVALLEGTIEIDSEFGRGSTFTIRLPAIPEAWSGKGDGAPRKTTTIVPTVPASQPSAADIRRGSRVLVVDDDPHIRDMMKRHLTERGLDVIVASNGREALKLIKSEKPDVITLDVVMPELNGWAVLAAIKNDPETEHLPVIMLTTMDEEGRGIALGADEFLLKPFEWSVLDRTLSPYCRDDENKHVLVVDDDPETRLLLRRQLESDGWIVDEAENGQAALEILKTMAPAVILLDLMMPVMDGFEFIVEREKRPALLEIPVIVVTAKEPTSEEIDRLHGSVARVLQKGSYSQDELLSEIHRRVDRHLQRTASLREDD